MDGIKFKPQTRGRSFPRMSFLGEGKYQNSGGGTRTHGPVVNSHLLYQLSYSGVFSIILVIIKKGGRRVKPNLELTQVSMSYFFRRR